MNVEQLQTRMEEAMDLDDCPEIVEPMETDTVNITILGDTTESEESMDTDDLVFDMDCLCKQMENLSISP